MRIDDRQRHLINRYQRDFPLTPRPFAVIGEELGLGEDETIALFRDLQESGVIGRIGAVVPPNRAGASTLAAMAVPAERLDEVAAIVSACPEVNHNYAREHRFNLWFVVTAATAADVSRVLAAIRRQTGLEVLDLPLERAYHIDLGFPI